MKNPILFVILGALVGGCVWFGEPETIELYLCDDLCEAYFDAEEDWADDNCGGFDGDDDSVEEECADACWDEWLDLNPSGGSKSEDQSRADKCMECVIDEIGSSPDYDDIISAWFDECEDECLDDDDVADFMHDFITEWWNYIDYNESDCTADHNEVFDW